MNLKTPIQSQASAAANKDGLAEKEHIDRKENKPFSGKRENAVALVITLLMLSVITFLAIAFLSMTKRDRSAVTATLDVDTARTMSDAALARAQTEIIAQMMAQTDILSYNYTASHNYVTPPGLFSTGDAVTPDSNNVNYDVLLTNGGTANAYWAQNIGNLFYDPRPPVFVPVPGTNGTQSNDFRFWVDINRNGRFETNGSLPTLDGNDKPIAGSTTFNDGEPEWIGVLKYPEYIHSPTNPFIGRYAFMALPIGKTLDLNFIHNYSKYSIDSGGNATMTLDAFTRDEGVGSWELNLAGFLDALSPAMYQTNTSVPAYDYVIGGGGNSGGAFDDASQFLRFRYGYNPNYPFSLGPNYPFSLDSMLGSPPLSEVSNIDEYGIYPSNQFANDSFDYAGYPPIVPTSPWPGTYNSNMFYDVQDLFDPNKTGPLGVTASDLSSGQNFAGRLAYAVSLPDTTNRYTFQRLLDCIGTSSAPEYGVYVYTNLFTNSAVPGAGTPGTFSAVPPPSWLRTKVNINYDNTAQIQAGPYSQTAAGPYGPFTPMPTNLVPWTPLGFFTNAADLLLRSQVFVYTNYVPVTNIVNGQPQLVYTPSNYLLGTFGITNIPVYAPGNPGIIYNEQVHRMLQLAANIYTAANPVYSGSGVQQPPVFRPQLGWSNLGGLNPVLYITNFVLVTNVGGSNAYTQINKNFYDLTDPRLTNSLLSAPSSISGDPNFWGIPWVVGAVKGLPAFDQYSYTSRVEFYRQLYFYRAINSSGKPDTTKPPIYTNQYYVMQISNLFGMDAWNPYESPFYGSGGGLTIFATNFVTITVTNNYNYITNIYVTNSLYFSNFTTPWQARQFMTFWQTNFTALPLSYFSEGSSPPSLVSTYPSYLAVDSAQTHWPVHSWLLNITNHLCYALIDGPASSGTLLDFVNLGPFGSSTNMTLAASNAYPQNGVGEFASQWTAFPATDNANSPMSQGVLNQISNWYSLSTPFYVSLNPNISIPGTSPVPGSPFTLPSIPSIPATPPYYVGDISCGWMACDPLVHYTVGDLTYPGYTFQNRPVLPNQMQFSMPNNNIGKVTPRYSPWPGPTGSTVANNMLFIDPQTNSPFKPDFWQFPTNLFPGIGWLGRVHRGTPWQTIYLKADNPNGEPNPTADWTNLWVNSPYTYPTNDWSILDLFTAVPNDNAARGLLSVNQTNDAAWAAVFAGVIAITSINTSTGSGTPIDPTTNGLYNFGVYNLMDNTNGINQARANTNYHANGLFHHIGDILQASVLTTESPYVANFIAAGGTPNDEMVERIPQQTLSLLKVGLPQFVIYSWGQSLKPKNLYSSGSGNLLNICTNYEITGEFLTRTVCHIVGDPGAAAPRIVIDNYNIEPGN
jgi:hypothetical protein